MRLGRSRRGVAGIVAAVFLFAMLFTVGTSYFLFTAAMNNEYSQSLVAASQKLQGNIQESLLVSTVLMTDGDVGFYVNNTSGVIVNMTMVLVYSSTSGLLQCDGVGIPASSGCGSTGNTAPPLWIAVNAGKGSAKIDTEYPYTSGTTYTLKIITQRGNQYTATYPPTAEQNSVQANTAQSLTVDPTTFKYMTIQANPASLVQSGYNGCTTSTCTLQYGRSVTAGNLLVLGLGWYNLNMPATPTDTVGTSFSLDTSSSVTYTYAPAYVRSGYNPNCGASTCGTTLNSVNQGDTLVFGLGWYNQNVPSTPTDTFGDTFTLGASNSVTYTPPSPSLVQSKYTSNCNSANCALQFNSNNNQGDTLVYGLGWYGSLPYVPVTVNNCQSQNSLALDGSNYADGASATLTATISTTHANDVIIVIVYGQNTQTGTYRTISSLTDTGSAGLSFTARSTYKEVSNAGGNSMFTQIWYAIASSTLSNEPIKLTWSSAPSLWGFLDVFGVSGANTASPFDSASLPNFPSVNNYPSVSTNNADDFIYGLENTASTSAPTSGSGFVGITTGVANSYTASEYKLVTSTQNALSITWGSNNNNDENMGWGDAIKAGTGCSNAPALDGSTGAGTETSSTSAYLSTANANDVIIVLAATSGTSNTVSVSDTGHNTWTQRAYEVGTSVRVEEWYTIATSQLSSDQITVQWQNSGDNDFAAFGISGANIAAPFDTYPALTKAQNSGTSPATTVYTSNPNDFIFGLVANEHTSAEVCHTETTGTGFTDIYPVNSGGSYYNGSCMNSDEEYDIVTSPQSSGLAASMSTSTGGTNYWAMISDAVVGAQSTPSTFQELVSWNPSSYSSYEASNLGNIRFCADAACATPLYGWLEGCGTTAPYGSCSTSSTQANAWIKLTSSISEGGTLNIYMVFYPTTANFDGNYWGEAPTLSGTYGQYDNGVNVFTFYDNFPSGDSNWNTVIYKGGTITFNNGVTLSANSNTYDPILVSKNTYTPGVEDADIALTSEQTTYSTPTLFYATTLPGTSGGDYGFQTNYRYDWYQPGGDFRSVRDSTGTATGGPTVTYGLPSTYNIWSATWSATGVESFAYNYATQYTSTDGGITYGSAYLGAAAIQGGQVSMYWLRLRAAPVNGVMPTATFGSVTGGNPLLSISDTYSDTFTLAEPSWIVSGASTYFSYIWFATASSGGQKDTITATFTNSITGTVSIYDLAGYTTAGWGYSSGSSLSSSSPAVSSFTPASSSFVIGNVETASSTSVISATTGYTPVATCSSVYGCGEYQSSSSGAVTVPMSLQSATAWAEAAISFPVASSVTYYSYVWYGTAGNSGTDTVSASFSQSVAGSVSLYEFSSTTLTGASGQHGGSTTATSPTSLSTALTPATGSVVVGNVEAATTTYSAGSGFTLVGSGSCSSVNGCSEYEMNSGTPNSVLMNLGPGEPWVEAAVAIPPKQVTYYSAIWYGVATGSGTDTVSVTFSQAPVASMSIYEITGYSTSGIVTPTPASSSSGSQTAQLGQFTPGGSSLVIANTEAASTTYTAGTGYTLVGTCSSVNGCSEYQVDVSSAQTASMSLGPVSVPWVEVGIAFPGAPALQSGIQVGGYPANGLPVNHNLAWVVQFTNQDPKGRSVTLWPMSLAAIQTIMAETVEITPFFIINGVSADGTTLIAYSQPYITIPYKATATVYFGATQPLGIGTDNVDQTEVAPFTGFFSLEGQYSDGTLFGLTVPYPAGQATQANAQESPTAATVSSTVTVSCQSPCDFANSAPAFVGWIDSTHKLTILATFTTTSSGNIPSGVTFQVPSYPLGYYTVMVSDYVNTVYMTFYATN